MPDRVDDNVNRKMNDDRDPMVSLEGLRAGLYQIPGVLAVSFEQTGERVDRVNIIAKSGSKSRGQIVQDAISYLYVTLGVRLRPDDVNVIRSTDGELAPTDRRPMLAKLETQYRGPGDKQVRVTLALEGQEYHGLAQISSGRDHTQGTIQAGIRATLVAANEIMKHRCQFELGDVRSLRLADEQVIIVAVRVYPEMGSKTLIGSARIRRDELDGAARAALDAINRAFSF